MFALSVLASLVFSGCVLNSDDSADTAVKLYGAESRAAIDKMIADGMATGVPGAAVGIWSEGYETLLIGRGKSDVALNRAVKPTDRFRIASITKTFTATAILMLADEKKLSLDDKISKYVTGITGGERVSIRDLGRHTGGVPDYTSSTAFMPALLANPLKVWTPEEQIGLIKDKPLEFDPGSKSGYSNSGFLILGMIVEKASGRKWSDFVNNRILKPLEMNDSYCPEDHTIKGEYAKGYLLSGTTPVEIVVHPSNAWAAGGIISTVGDLKKWLVALRTGALLTPSTAAERLNFVDSEEPGLKYGFGLKKFDDRFIGHTGTYFGYNSVAVMTPEGKHMVVVLHNHDAEMALGTAKDLIRYVSGIK
jgi:D-alanyl-D-alanine carboxypeptidase